MILINTILRMSLNTPRYGKLKLSYSPNLKCHLKKNLKPFLYFTKYYIHVKNKTKTQVIDLQDLVNSYITYISLKTIIQYYYYYVLYCSQT